MATCGTNHVGVADIVAELTERDDTRGAGQKELNLLEALQDALASNWAPLTDLQDSFEVFVCYIFDRRYGWSEVYSLSHDGQGSGTILEVQGQSNTDSPPHITSKEVIGDTPFASARPSTTPATHKAAAVYKQRVNDALDLFIERLRHESLPNRGLLQALKKCSQTTSRPVVREQTLLFTFEWLLYQLSQKEKARSRFDDMYDDIRDVIMIGITDVWSAIRKGCAGRLTGVMEVLESRHLEGLFKDLFSVCLRKGEEHWKAKEGCAIAMTNLLKRFRTDLSEVPISQMSIPSSPSNLGEFQGKMLKFGTLRYPGLPPFVVGSMRAVLFNLLADPQLSVRENAQKAFSAYLAKMPVAEAKNCFVEILKRLRPAPREGWSEEQREEGGLVEAYEAEGLLGVCKSTLKVLPHDFILTNQTDFFGTFDLYLAHSASTVRQSTSNIFKAIITKNDMALVVMMVLSNLCDDWVVPSFQELSSKSAQLNSGDKKSWQWREGRLLAYELVLNYLCTNLNNFAALQGSPASKRGSPRADFRSSPPKTASESNINLPSQPRQPSSSFSGGRVSDEVVFLTPVKSSRAKSDMSGSDHGGDHDSPTQHRRRVSSPQVRSELTEGGAEVVRIGMGSKSPGVFDEAALLCTPSPHKSPRTVLQGCCTLHRDVLLTVETSLVEQLEAIESMRGAAGKFASSFDTPGPSLVCPKCAEMAVGIPPMSSIFRKMLLQTMQSFADSQFELRRMADQVLKPLTEVISWFDVGILEELWVHFLSSGDAIPVYTSCSSLKFTLRKCVQTQQLLHYNRQVASPSFKARGQKVIHKIQSALPRLLPAIFKTAQNASNNKVTLQALELLLMAHTSFGKFVSNDDQQLHVAAIRSRIGQVFSSAHPPGSLDSKARKQADSVGRSTLRNILSSILLNSEGRSLTLAELDARFLEVVGLSWYGFTKHYGTIEEFVSSTPELFKVDGDGRINVVTEPTSPGPSNLGRAFSNISLLEPDKLSLLQNEEVRKVRDAFHQHEFESRLREWEYKALYGEGYCTSSDADSGVAAKKLVARAEMIERALTSCLYTLMPDFILSCDFQQMLSFVPYLVNQLVIFEDLNVQLAILDTLNRIFNLPVVLGETDDENADRISDMPAVMGRDRSKFRELVSRDLFSPPSQDLTPNFPSITRDPTTMTKAKKISLLNMDLLSSPKKGGDQNGTPGTLGEGTGKPRNSIDRPTNMKDLRVTVASTADTQKIVVYIRPWVGDMDMLHFEATCDLCAEKMLVLIEQKNVETTVVRKVMDLLFVLTQLRNGTKHINNVLKSMAVRLRKEGAAKANQDLGDLLQIISNDIRPGASSASLGVVESVAGGDEAVVDVDDDDDDDDDWDDDDDDDDWDDDDGESHQAIAKEFAKFLTMLQAKLNPVDDIDEDDEDVEEFGASGDDNSMFDSKASEGPGLTVDVGSPRSMTFNDFVKQLSIADQGVIKWLCTLEQ